MMLDDGPAKSDVERTYSLWTISEVPLAEAIQIICVGKDLSYRIQVMNACQEKLFLRS